MKNLKGFTLVEMIVTVIVIITLSSISVPIYRGYIADVKIAEGYALLGAFRSAQESYFAEHGCFLDDRITQGTGLSYSTCNDEVLRINAMTNKYYTLFFWDTTPEKRDKFFIAKVYGGSNKVTPIYMIYDVTAGVTYACTSSFTRPDTGALF